MSDDKCGRDSEGYLLWPGREPMPVCSYHKNAPLTLGRMMGWSVTFTVGDAGPCESLDSHPDDKEEGE
jgi:hypothetical protein